MLYKVIGLMSGSSLDGLDMAYVQLQETGGQWSFELLHTDCLPYSADWADRLAGATALPALDYQFLHTAFGHYCGEAVNAFIKTHQLEHNVHLVASHGHTSFHRPDHKTTAQLGDGAAIAAITGLPVVSDLRAVDIALGGQGAPIVPIGEKLLFGQYKLLLNLGGIANLSLNEPGQYRAFDVCPANRVLNLLAQQAGKSYDEGGRLAASGTVHQPLLQALDSLDYYGKAYPKSLANEFGTGVVYPLIMQYQLPVQDALCTYVEHIARQIAAAAQSLLAHSTQAGSCQLLATGGGALNTFLVERISACLQPQQVETMVPGAELINFKEALVMALIGVLRWREEDNVLSSVTGASRNSINGALWMGNS